MPPSHGVAAPGASAVARSVLISDTASAPPRRRPARSGDVGGVGVSFTISGFDRRGPTSRSNASSCAGSAPMSRPVLDVGQDTLSSPRRSPCAPRRPRSGAGRSPRLSSRSRSATRGTDGWAGGTARVLAPALATRGIVGQIAVEALVGEADRADEPRRGSPTAGRGVAVAGLERDRLETNAAKGTPRAATRRRPHGRRAGRRCAEASTTGCASSRPQKGHARAGVKPALLRRSIGPSGRSYWRLAGAHRALPRAPDAAPGGRRRALGPRRTRVRRPRRGRTEPKQAPKRHATHSSASRSGHAASGVQRAGGLELGAGPQA